MKDFSYILTTNSISIDFDDNYFVVNKSDSKKYSTVKKYIKSGEYDKIIELLVPAKRIMVYSNEFFSVDDKGKLFMKDKPNDTVPELISQKLLDFIGEELPIEPLVKFWKKLRNNPSEESRKDLYAFLDKNNHPITPEGNFIAYKKVTTKTENGRTILVDSHTRKINNSVGCTPMMKRSDVNPNRNQTCSTGLHVAAMNYAKTFSGDTLIKVAVDPSDVVAVPIDYNREKMRVCKYTVVAVMNDNKIKNKSILDRIPKSKDLNKIKLQPSNSNFNVPISSNNKKMVADLRGLTAKEIIEKVHNDIKIKINVSLKNKQTIVRKAQKYYKSRRYEVITN